MYKTRSVSRLGCIDGLRGYLALLVFIHHFVITYYWKIEGSWTRPPEDYFNNFGQAGVSLFFMITGYLFISKILSQREKINWIKFYISRIFRIVPLYTFVLGIIILTVAIETSFTLHVDVGQFVGQILRWVFFVGSVINEFHDTEKIIASVDWSLKYEWLFYLLLPIIAQGILKSRMLLFYTIFVVIVASEIALSIWSSYNSSCLILFLIGGVTAKIKTVNYKVINYMDHWLITIIAIASLIVVINCFKTSFGLTQALLLSIFFIPVALGNSMFGILKLDSSIFLGEISYSIYLMHGIVLYFTFSLFFPNHIASNTQTSYMLLMPIIAVLVILISWATYIFIEKPMNIFGKQLSNRLIKNENIADFDKPINIAS